MGNGLLNQDAFVYFLEDAARQSRITDLCSAAVANRDRWREFEMLVQQKHSVLLAAATGIAEDIATTKKVHWGTFSLETMESFSMKLFPHLSPLQRYHVPGALLGLWSGIRLSLLAYQHAVIDQLPVTERNWLDAAFPGIREITFWLAERHCETADKMGLMSLLQERLYSQKDWYQELRHSILRTSYGTICTGLSLGLFLIDALDSAPTFSRFLVEGSHPDAEDEPRHVAILQEFVNLQALGSELVNLPKSKDTLDQAHEYFMRNGGKPIMSAMEVASTRQEAFNSLRAAIYGALTEGIAFGLEQFDSGFKGMLRDIYSRVRVQHWAQEYARLYALQKYGEMVGMSQQASNSWSGDIVRQQLVLGFLATKTLVDEDLLFESDLAKPRFSGARRWSKWYKDLSEDEKQRFRRLVYASPSLDSSAGLLEERLREFYLRDRRYAKGLDKDWADRWHPSLRAFDSDMRDLLEYKRLLYCKSDELLRILPTCSIGKSIGRDVAPGALYLEFHTAKASSDQLKNDATRVWTILFEATAHRPVVRLGDIARGAGLDVVLASDLINWLQMNELIKVSAPTQFDSPSDQNDRSRQVLSVTPLVSDRQTRIWMDAMFDSIAPYRSEKINQQERGLVNDILQVCRKRKPGILITKEALVQEIFSETGRDPIYIVNLLQDIGLLIQDPAENSSIYIWTLGPYRAVQELRRLLTQGKRRGAAELQLPTTEFDSISDICSKFMAPPVGEIDAWLMDAFAPWNRPWEGQMVRVKAPQLEYLVALGNLIECASQKASAGQGAILEAVREKVDRAMAHKGRSD